MLFYTGQLAINDVASLDPQTPAIIVSVKGNNKK